MLQSMFSGISGLRSHQRRMDVVGNNIANVNTPGFKGSSVTFKEAYVTTLRAPAPGTPGQQVGLGVQVGGIAKNFSGGILMETGLAANMGVSGEGFFVVAERGADPDRNFFTRAGDFQLDVYDDGGGPATYLINPDGMRLRGVLGTTPADLDMTGMTELDLVDIQLPTDTSSFSIGLDGVIYASIAGGSPEAVGRIALARFDNNSALESLGSNLYRQNPASGIRAFTNPGEAGAGQVFQGYLENSNVDLAREFTDMIITQRGFQANSRSITTSDEMLAELLMLKR